MIWKGRRRQCIGALFLNRVMKSGKSGAGILAQTWTAPQALLAVIAFSFSLLGGAAVAQDGSFFSNDVFIEEDVMIEGTFDSGFVTETYDEAVEEPDTDEPDYEDDFDSDTIADE